MFPRLKNKVQGLLYSFRYNNLIRVALESYLVVSIGVFLNLHYIMIGVRELISTSITMLFFLSFAGFTIFPIWLIIKRKDKLS
jgi:hypothetical protein